MSPTTRETDVLTKFKKNYSSRLPPRRNVVPEPVHNIRTVLSRQTKMKRILVINSKGGCGKSTISTNLAAMLNENKQNHVALVDYDPQGSSKKWLNTRSKRLGTLNGLFPACDNVSHFRRTWHLLLDQSTSHVVIDTPAGTNGIELTERIHQADMLLVPVMPSAIDIRASADFIGKAIINSKFRHSNKRIAVVANRVTQNSESFKKLERFLYSLKIPFIATFNEHPSYLLAAEHGCGINELPPSEDFPDTEEWNKLLHWVETDSTYT